MPSPLILGALDLLEPLGRGGMGEVWRAWHRVQQLPVAVKVLHAGAQDAGYVHHLRAEARAVAALDHPHIALLLDHGEVSAADAAASDGRLAAGSPTLVLELASGGTLQRWVRQPPGWGRVRGALLALLDGLGHAHARGRLHRDLKPSNVLVCTAQDLRPGLKITDFGVSVREGAAAWAAGTPGYMPPEQRAGARRDQGPWTDLYALGVLAWGLSQGAEPWAEGGDALDPASWAWNLPRLACPAGLEDWLRRLVAPEPGRRYARAADAAMALLALEDARWWAGIVPRDPLAERGEDGGDTTGTPPPVDTPPPTWTFGAQATMAPGGLGGELDAVALPSTERPPPLPRTWRRAALPDLVPRLQGAGLRLLGLRVPPLVGREDVCDALWGALAAVVAGRAPRAVLLTGPSGVGLSRLARWLAERAHEVGAAEIVTATARPEPGPEDGLGPALARALRVDGLRDAALRRALAVRLPALPDDVRERLAWTLQAADEEGGAGAWRAALAGLVGARVGVVVLDDLPCDAEAARFAAAVISQATRPPLPVLLVATASDELQEAHPECRRALTALWSAPGTTALRVEPLAPAQRGALVRAVIALSPGTEAAVIEATQGMPAQVLTLLRAWMDAGALSPQEGGLGVSEGALVLDGAGAPWRRRAERLLDGRPEAERTALALAALLGMTPERAIWAGAASALGLAVDIDALADALDEAGLARRAEGGLAFVHYQAREALLDPRPALHAAAVVALQADPDLRPERRGRHLAALARWDEAATDLLAGVARRMNEHETRLSLALADEAAAALEKAGAPDTDPRRAKLADLRVRMVSRAQGTQEAAAMAPLVAEAERVLALPLDPATADAWRGMYAQALATQSRYRSTHGAWEEGLRLADQALAVAAQGGDRLGELVAIRARAWALKTGGQMAQASACFQDGLARATGPEAEVARGMLLYGLALVESERGHLDACEAALTEAEPLFVRHRRVFYTASALILRSEVARQRGDLDAAVAHNQAALALHEAYANPEVVVPLLNLGLLALLRGEHAAARELLEPTLQLCLRNRRRTYATVAHGGLLALCAQDPRSAPWDEHLGAISDALDARQALEPDLARTLERAAALAAEAGLDARAQQATALAQEVWARLGR